MQTPIVFVLAVLTWIFSLTSWAITADLMWWYRLYSRVSFFWYGYAHDIGEGNGSTGPLAVSAVELVIALLIFFFTPALAFFAWREQKDIGSIPRWLNLTVFGLSSVGLVVAIAQFGVFAHEDMLAGEIAGQAATFFLTTLFGISATILPFLPTSWTAKLKELKSTASNPVGVTKATPKSADIEAAKGATSETVEPTISQSESPVSNTVEASATTSKPADIETDTATAQETTTAAMQS